MTSGSPQPWRVLKVRDLGKVVTGRTPSKNNPDHFGDIYPFITPTDMADTRKVFNTERRLSEAGARALQRTRVPAESISVSCIGWQMGKSIITVEPSFTNQQLNTIIPNRELADPLFLYYSFSARRDELFRLASGGSRTPILNKSHFEALDVLVPSLPEQRSIAHILGTLDDKIELNRRMNVTLEAISRAIFQSWFVDFDPVHAKARGEQPYGMDAETAALFPDAFEESALGPIPAGWRVGHLSDLVDLQSGYAFRSKDWTAEGIPVVKIGSIKPGVVDLSEVSFIPLELAKQFGQYRLREGDLLIGMTGYVGEVGLVPPTQVPPLLNQRVGKFVVNEGLLDLPFVYCLARRREFKALVEERSHGTAQANVSGTAILGIPVILPSDRLRVRFNENCLPILRRIIAGYGESRILAELRDTLLPKLISGQLRVEVN